MCVCTFLPYLWMSIGTSPSGSVQVGLYRCVHIGACLATSVSVVMCTHLPVGIHTASLNSICPFGVSVPFCVSYTSENLPCTCSSVSVAVHMLVRFWVCIPTCEGLVIFSRLQAWLYQGEQDGLFHAAAAAAGLPLVSALWLLNSCVPLLCLKGSSALGFPGCCP